MPDDQPEEIIININGSSYGGWKAADVTCSMDSVCGEFNVSLMDKWSEQQMPHEIKPGDECQVMLGDEPVITGYVDEVSPEITKETHSIKISGRDKTCDLVDCSAEIPQFEAYKTTLDVLANMLCKSFGIQVKVETDVGEPLDRIAVQMGETCFDCLERAAKKCGVLLTTDGEGALVLAARNNFQPSGETLKEGENILSGTASLDFRDRFQVYRAHGQVPSWDDGATTPLHQEIGEARDQNFKRYRPLFVTCEMWSTNKDAKARADNECAYRAGRSTRANISVLGWRGSGGQLWRPRTTVKVTSPSLYFADNTELVISSVRYSFSDSDGTQTELELTRPDAYLKSGSGEVGKDPLDND